MPYTPSLDRCRDSRYPPTALVTVRGKGRTHDYIQICREFEMNYLGSAISDVTRVTRMPKGLGISDDKIRQARAAGKDPVDIVLDASHLMIRAVSRLYLFACKFASLLKYACLSVETGVRY